MYLAHHWYSEIVFLCKSEIRLFFNLLNLVIHSAIYGVISAIGPVFGLFVGGSLLSLYVDFDRVDV